MLSGSDRNSLSFRLRTAICLSVLVWAAQARSAADDGELARATSGASEIRASLLRNDLEFITADELHGRAAPSAGLDLTARFIANRLFRAGLKPAGESATWFQTIRLIDTRIVPERTSGVFGEHIFKYGQDFLLRSPFETTAAGPVAYVGDGWVIKATGHDPYKSVNVGGKFVVVADAEPPSDLLRGKYGADWMKPRDAALAHGAKGIIYMSGMPRGWTADHVVDVFRPAQSEQDEFLDINVSRVMLDSLFEGEEITAGEILAGLPKNLRDRWKAGGRFLRGFEFSPGKELELRVVVTREHPSTRNVIAVLEGSDPALKNEYMVIGAHYDTLRPGDTSGQEAHPGADDNGSGAVALLSIAEAMAIAPPPKRSILFIWHTGEEERGWGSRYFTEHPTVPLNRIVAYINLDMIGRSQAQGAPPPQLPFALTGPDEVEVSGSEPLVADARRVNSGFLNMQFTSQQHLGGSDHELYRAKGIPILCFTTRTHSDMHRPGDTADKIDYDKMQRIARTVYATAHFLANNTLP